jgi:hypothetical protein
MRQIPSKNVNQREQLGITDLQILENETHNLSHDLVTAVVDEFLLRTRPK